MPTSKVTSVRLNPTDLDSLKAIEQKHAKHVHLSQSDLIKIAINEYAGTIRTDGEKKTAEKPNE